MSGVGQDNTRRTYAPRNSRRRHDGAALPNSAAETASLPGRTGPRYVALGAPVDNGDQHAPTTRTHHGGPEAIAASHTPRRRGGRTGIFAMSVVAGLTFATTACSSSNSATTSSDTAGAAATTTDESAATSSAPQADKQIAAPTGEPATLRVLIWDESQSPTLQTIIDEFTAAHQNVKVTLDAVPFGEYPQTVQAAIAAGNSYDVIWLNAPNIPTFVSNSVVRPLDDLIDRDKFDTSVFPKGLIDLYTVDGKSYAVPKDFDTIGLYYNRDMFRAAGVDEPTNDWTWDDLRSAAKALTTDTQRGFVATPAPQELLYPLVFSAGGHPLNADGTATQYSSPQACSALKYLSSFHAAGTSPDMASQDATWYVEMFTKRQVAMITSGSWDARAIVEALGDSVGVVEFPAGTREGNVIHGLGWAIVNGSNNTGWAWELIKALNTKTAHQLQANNGTAIPSYAGTADTWRNSFDTVDVSPFIDAAKIADPYPIAQADSGWEAAAYRRLSDELAEGDFAELCDSVDKAANDYIANHRTSPTGDGAG